MSRLTRADLSGAVPDLQIPVQAPSIRSGATVIRDAWGIPHIRADDEYDLFFAQGFATAQDRMWQMDFDRMRALGRISEYLGPGSRATDALLRRRRLDRSAKADLALCSTPSRLAIDAYTDGVNAFLQSAAPLAVEFRLLETTPAPWEPWHCILLYKIRNAAEGSFQAKLWLAQLAARRGARAVAKICPGYPQGQLLTVPPGQSYDGPALDAAEELQAVVDLTAALRESDGGSNGWAVAGQRTVSGLPLVAGDSHRLLEVPNVYYQIHLIGPDFAALGYAIPGMPLVMHFMHNEYVAWGMTHGVVDTQDLYVERLRPRGDGGVEYLFDERWIAAEVGTETINARGTEPDVIEVVTTHHGAVIATNADATVGIALSDPGAGDATPWVDATYQAMKARSADAFEAAMEGWTDRVNNYPYADVHGSFGYALRGRIPVRDPVNGWGPVAGWSATHEWRGIIPAAELPRSRDPHTGWVVTCNQRVVDERYPYYLTHSFGPDYRARRIIARLQARGTDKLAVADMAAIHADAQSLPAQVVIQALAGAEPASPDVRQALQTLRDWDGVMDRDSAAAAIWGATNREICRALVLEHHGLTLRAPSEPGAAGAVDHLRRQLRPAFIAMLERGGDALLPAGVSVADFLLGAIERAVAELTVELGSAPHAWRWGALHRMALRHPLSAVFPECAELLDPPAVPVSGDGDVPWASSHWALGSFDVGVGPVNRYILDPSNWSNGQWVVPLGASGHPGSAHFCDQQQLWADVETIPQLWEWDDIVAGATATQVFSPE